MAENDENTEYRLVMYRTSARGIGRMLGMVNPEAAATAFYAKNEPSFDGEWPQETENESEAVVLKRAAALAALDRMGPQAKRIWGLQRVDADFPPRVDDGSCPGDRGGHYGSCPI